MVELGSYDFALVHFWSLIPFVNRADHLNFVSVANYVLCVIIIIIKTLFYEGNTK